MTPDAPRIALIACSGFEKEIESTAELALTPTGS